LGAVGLREIKIGAAIDQVGPGSPRFMQEATM
jgi:hypothetical protein